MQAETSRQMEQAASVAVPHAAMEPAPRYDGLSILLHRLTAVLVIFLWSLAHHYLLRDPVLRRMLP